MRAKKAVELLQDEKVSPEQIRAVAAHGREGLMDLFRILTTAPEPAQREAAGEALSLLWARDQLVAEEEKAVVSRGFRVDWVARRRYPRGMRRAFPVEVRFGLPFLKSEGAGGVRSDQLEWSYQITGAERAALEALSAWTPGPVQVTVPIEPGDFAGNGPHRLVLKARARTSGLTEKWELELPHMPFSFEFDPILRLDALLTMPDELRAEQVGRAVTLTSAHVDGAATARFIPLGNELAFREPPVLAIQTPLACDLAHRVVLEFEGFSGQVEAGQVVLSGQGTSEATTPGVATFPLCLEERGGEGLPDRPGEYRARAILRGGRRTGLVGP